MESGNIEKGQNRKEQTQSEKWKNKANWRNLRNGMTMKEVRSLLGEPERVSQTSSFTWWHYGYGNVDFNKHGFVQGWMEPLDF